MVAAGDAAGEGLVAGLVAGLAVVAGAVSVVALGEAVVAGVDVVAGEFEFELLVGSSEQPTAKNIARRAGSSNAVRFISLDLELLICLPRSSKIEKQGDNCPGFDYRQ